MPEQIENLNYYIVDEFCTACDGKGKTIITITSTEGSQTNEQNCKLCNGTGKISAGTLTTPVSD